MRIPRQVAAYIQPRPANRQAGKLPESKQALGIYLGDKTVNYYNEFDPQVGAEFIKAYMEMK